MSKKKVCQLCGKTFYKPIKMGMVNWNKMKYCSKTCHDEAYHIMKLSSLMEINFDYLKKELIKIYLTVKGGG